MSAFCPVWCDVSHLFDDPAQCSVAHTRLTFDLAGVPLTVSADQNDPAGRCAPGIPHVLMAADAPSGFASLELTSTQARTLALMLTTLGGTAVAVADALVEAAELIESGLSTDWREATRR